MILREGDRVLVQGISGKQGSFWTEKMQACGTRVVGGVSPRLAGEIHLGVPVFASARQAMAEAPFDIAVMFIPPLMAREAALDAIEAGARLLIVLTEHIPLQDVLAIHAEGRRRGTRILGPNTPGIVTPGTGFAGIMPAHNPRVFRPGRAGVISRSGSLGTLICLNLTRLGIGQSAFIGVGGDALAGTTMTEALEALEMDERTDVVVLAGEIGGTMEERAAEHAAAMRKPVVAFVAGAASPPGKKMGHAGAIVTGSRGSYASKRSRFEASGVRVLDTPFEIARAVAELIPASG